MARRGRRGVKLLLSEPAMSGYVARALAEGGKAGADLFHRLLSAAANDRELVEAGLIREDADPFWRSVQQLVLIVGPLVLRPLVELCVLVQVTAASVDGRMGRRPQECGLRLIQLGLGHLISSDAHHASVREVGMVAAADAVGGGELAQWLTVDVPAAILADELTPPRPQGGTSGGWLGRLLGS